MPQGFHSTHWTAVIKNWGKDATDRYRQGPSFTAKDQPIKYDIIKRKAHKDDLLFADVWQPSYFLKKGVYGIIPYANANTRAMQ